MDLLEWHANATRASALTEESWETCKQPLVMLAWLQSRASVPKTKDGRRRLRLFACACARRYWDEFGRQPHKNVDALRSGVEAAERFADGEMDRAAFEAAVAVAREEGQGISVLAAPAFIAGHATLAVAFEGAWEVARLGPCAGGDWSGPPFWAEQRAECELLRDVFGNPFRPAKRPACLPRRGGTIRALAETIYRDRTFAELPVLADALEDAGCSDDVILSHLRAPGPHVRGCWAVDLLRG
jgi:hypothetical protein